MFIQTETTPNPNTLKFLPGKIVSEVGPVEFINKDKTNNELVRNILSITGVNMVFLGNDFITVKKNEELIWDDLKHIIISLINDYYLEGKKSVLNKTEQVEEDIPQDEVVKKINEILDTKIRPAVARDGGDIKFKSFKDGLVKVELKGSCSGCPSSVMTLKQGVQNLLCHYIPEVKNVEAL
ncbi:MAG: NifU family protein [Candidatus Pelagibacterales bacterium]|nr:MAG: NifU family protein [Pelagibacterales bacterium]|tara:strand:- start:535 stop:1077 length:543 start_codon:yes stop_codon:yes gene_type:complete